MNVARTSMARLTVAAIALGAAGARADAQDMRLGSAIKARDCSGTFILLSYPKAPDKKTAAQALVDLRQQINSIFEAKDLCAVDKKQSDGILTASSFPADSVLSVSDFRTLAANMRADEFLMFEVAVQGSRFQYSGTLYLSRDEHLRDPIPKPPPGDNSSLGAKELAYELKKLRKELEFEKKCYQLTTDQKYAEAEAEARKGIAAVPDGTIARVCLANAMILQKKPAEQIIAVTDEILKRDPKNIVPLLLALDAYLAKGDQAKYAEVAGQVVALDAGHPAVEGIVDNLVAWKQTDIAMPIIAKALIEAPDNQKLLRNEFRLLYGGNHFKEAADKGEKMAKLDTAVVDSTFIERMFTSYANEKNDEKLLEWLSKGFAKYPANMKFAQGVAQQLKAMGRIPEAIDAYKKVLRISPKEPKVHLFIALNYNDLGQVDSTVVWLHKANDAGDDKATIAGVASQIGAKILKAAQDNKVAEDNKKAIPFFAFSDSVSATDQAKYYWGVAAYGLALPLLQKLQANQGTCDDARQAKDWALIANEKIHDGAKFNPETAVKLLPELPNYIQYADSKIKDLKC